MIVVLLLVSLVHGLVSLWSLRAGFFLFVLLYAVFPRFLEVGVSEHGFALTGQRTMIAALAFLFLLHWLYGSSHVRRAVRILKDNKSVFLLLVGILLAKIAGNVVAGRLNATEFATFANEFLLSVFVVVLTVTCVVSRRDIYLVLILVVLSLFINQLAAIAEYIKGGSLFVGAVELDFSVGTVKDQLAGAYRVGSYRVRGLLESSLELAALSCIALPFALVLVRKFRESPIGVLAAAALALLIPVVIWTGSRSGLSMLILLAGFVTFRLFCKPLSSTGRTVAVAVATVVAIPLAVMFLDDAVRLFFSTADAQQTRSAMSRFNQYVFAIPLLSQSPWFGFGFARNIVSVVDINWIDSVYLRTAMEGGAVGLALLLMLLARTSLSLFRIRRTAILRSDWQLTDGLLLSQGCLMILMLVLNLPSSILYLFLIVGLTLVLDESMRPNRPHTEVSVVNENA